MAKNFDRRTIVLAGAAAAATAALPRVALAQAQPLRLGLMNVKTGPLAEGGIQMEQGLTAFLKDRNMTLAGRKVELIVADTGGNPAGAKNKVQELVERDHVDVITGPLAAFELLAITDYIAQHKIPTLSLAAAEDMTQRKPNPYFLRASATSSQAMKPLADYAAKELKFKTRHLHRRGFRLRLRADGRLPAGVRGCRRQGSEEALAAARHRRLHPLYRADQRVRRRGARASPPARRSSS